MCAAFDDWLRDPSRRFNPGTTADLVTAALYAALRDGTIRVPLSCLEQSTAGLPQGPGRASRIRSHGS